MIFNRPICHLLSMHYKIKKKFDPSDPDPPSKRRKQEEDNDEEEEEE